MDGEVTLPEEEVDNDEENADNESGKGDNIEDDREGDKSGTTDSDGTSSVGLRMRKKEKKNQLQCLLDIRLTKQKQIKPISQKKLLETACRRRQQVFSTTC